MTKVLEGTWEEIAARADEFRGKQLRVEWEETPQNDEARQQELRTKAMKRFGAVQGGPTDASERVSEIFGEILEEKYREGRL